MSFFGLTSFGPESIISSSSKRSNGFTLFNDDEYRQGFHKCLKENQTSIKVCQLKDVFYSTFGFNALEEEIETMRKALGKNNDEDVNWEEFHTALQFVRVLQEQSSTLSTKFNSYQKYYDERYKHIRNEHKPSDTFKLPVSSGQAYGFFNFKERNLNNVRYPKKKCEETKYAEAIVLSGKQFMK